MITNNVTRAIFELIGDKVHGGYSLPVSDTQVPIFLNKDGTTQYPQIRVSPFIQRGDVNYQKYIEKKYKAYRHWQYGVFQVDIYSKNLMFCQEAYDTIEKRLFDYFNLETVLFFYSNGFSAFDTNTYRCKEYALMNDGLFKDIYGITVGLTILKKVKSLNELVDESYYVDESYLYVKTKGNIEDIQIKVLLQGKLFSNGFSFSDNGLHDYNLSNQRNLSSLEKNDVERISFDLEILFSEKLNRESLPNINGVEFKIK